jgi:Na+/glutamate symporter
MLALRLKLNSSRVAIIQADFELATSGDFPKEEWLEMFRVQMHLLQALGAVGHSLMRLDRVWRKRLVSTTAFLNQPLVSSHFEIRYNRKLR